MNDVNPIDMLDRTQDRAAAVLSGIEPAHMILPTPCGDWTVKTEINKLIASTMHNVISVTEDRYDEFYDLGVPPELAGDDPAAAYRAAAAACREAFAIDGVFDRVLHAPVPGAQFPGDQVLGVRIFDTTVVTWDLARATGQDHGIGADQARFALMIAEVIVPAVAGAPDRARFGEAVPVGDDADALTRLVATCGRDPHWTR